MMKKQSRFTAEFNMQPIKRLLEGGHELSELANELGLSIGQLSTWRKEQLAAGSVETLWLRHELKWLEEENLILRKAAVFLCEGSRDEACLRIGRARQP